MPSPLFEAARDAGAVYAPDGTMPLSFGDVAAEYRSALDSAVLIDCSDRGKLEATGAEAATFLHNLCTNDIVNLPLGGGCEVYFCDQRAKTLAHALVYHVLIDVARHAFWLDVTPSYGQKLLKHLDRHLIAERVELSDRSDEFAQMHLAGPNAKQILEQALGDSIPELREFLHMERTFGTNATCHIRRHDPLGVPGFDIVCASALAADIWKLLAAAGAKPAGSQAYEILRIEAGAPVYGIDMDENRFVMELPRALRAVSYAKGCYLGQEPIVMARDRAGHVNRAFLGMKVLEGDVLPHGSKLLREGQEVGIVTSSIQSPRLGSPLALGYIRRGHQEPGTRLEAETASGKRAVEVLGFPPIGSAG
jgi:folate-binding protein YgfZ